MSFRAPALALGAALVLHAGLLMALVRPEAAQMAGADAAPEAQLGNSFADMAEVAQAVTPVSAAPAPSAPKPVAAAPAAHAQPAAKAAPAALAPTSAPAIPPAPVSARALNTTTKAAQAAPVEPSVQPKAPTVLKPQQKPKTAKKVREQTPKKEAKTVKRETAPKPQKAAKKGSSAGTSKGKSATPSKTKKKAAKPAGNASASNYKGRVMRHLSRRVRFSNKGSGVTRIRFTIDARGRIAGASVTKSSGAASLDRKALKAVRRAAPFPRPPSGQSMTFSVPIAVR